MNAASAESQSLHMERTGSAADEAAQAAAHNGDTDGLRATAAKSDAADDQAMRKALDRNGPRRFLDRLRRK